MQRESPPGKGWPRAYLVGSSLWEDTAPPNSLEGEVNRGVTAAQFMLEGRMAEEARAALA